jgi:dCMP deaminase
MKRPSIDEYYLNIARAVSMRSTCLKKHYGAVIVKNNEIVSTGYNNPPRGEAHCATCSKTCVRDGDTGEFASCPAVHAEQNAIISASRQEMLGADLYLAGFDVASGQDHPGAGPCEICLRLIKNAGIDRIITCKGTIYLRSDEGILRQIKETGYKK